MGKNGDFDFGVTSFEMTPKREIFQLFYCWTRASYVRGRSSRHLLNPGKRESLQFQSGRLTSRRFQAGSQPVVVPNIIKQSGEQINYGTGKGVSDETIADAKERLQIKWSSQSFVEIPVNPMFAPSPCHREGPYGWRVAMGKRSSTKGGHKMRSAKTPFDLRVAPPFHAAPSPTRALIGGKTLRAVMEHKVVQSFTSG